MRHIIFVPDIIMSEKQLIKQIKINSEKPIECRGKFAGWIYTEDEYIYMFDGAYEIEREENYKNTKIYYLQKIEP